MAPIAKMGKTGTNNNSRLSQNTAARSDAAVTSTEPVDESRRSSVSLNYGKAGMQIPTFTDLNVSHQDAHKIKSTDLLLKFSLERILGKPELKGPMTLGLKGKAGLAFSYWPTQLGSGEPSNYFASNGSVFNVGKGLHSGDIINIKGLWWTFTPEFSTHYSVNSYLELGAAAGLSIYGYPFMTISDPWSGFSTLITDEDNVGHSQFLQDHFKSFMAFFDWSFNLLLKSPGRNKRLFIEIGTTGPIFNFGIGTETLLSGKNK
jgi:hypothetical protein